MSDSTGPRTSAGSGLRTSRNPEDAAETELSSGGAVFRRSPRGVELLVGHQTDWNTRAKTLRLPKGHVEGAETVEEAAVREVAEETGRSARILEQLGQCEYAYENLKTGEAISKRVVFFLMEDLGSAEDARDAEMDPIEWLPIADAIEALTFENERHIARLAAARLEADDLPTSASSASRAPRAL